MSHDRYLLPLGVLLLAMLPVFHDAHAGQWTPVRDEVTFQCDNAVAPSGSSVYVVGNHPNPGNWDPTKAIKLNNAGSTWTGKVLFPGADDSKVWSGSALCATTLTRPKRQRCRAVPTTSLSWLLLQRASERFEV